MIETERNEHETKWQRRERTAMDWVREEEREKARESKKKKCYLREIIGMDIAP